MDKASLLAKIKAKRNIDLLDGCFEKQINFIKDPCNKKVVLCARRAGKSTALGIMLLEVALNNPGSSCLFVSMTNSTCQKILFKDILEPLIIKFKLEKKIKITKGSNPRVDFSNGSVIYLFGVDSSEDQKDKLLGQKNRLVVMDECQDIRVNLKDLIIRVLSYTVVDYNGTMVMSGSPSDDVSTYFYEMTKDYNSKDGWSFHKWSALDNPYTCKQLQQKDNEDFKNNPLIRETAAYKQMTLGLWVINSLSLVYRPKLHNFITENQLPIRNDWIYILGVDFGFTDADGFVVIGWLPDDKHLYILEAHVQSGNDDFSTADTIKRLSLKYNFANIVVDGSSKKTVETLKERFQLPLEATDKVKKFDFISLFNQDLDSGVIKILPQPKEKLVEEWSKLIWNPSKPRFEKDGLNNHCFVAGTKIKTNIGEINIEDINKNHFVLTRDGYKPVKIATKTGLKKVYKIITDDGKELIGTGNHPIFANNQWIEISNIKIGDILTCISEHQKGLTWQTSTEKALKSFTTELITEDIQIHQIQNYETIGQAKKVKGFIELFGKKILEKYRKSITFIIKMVIHLIMIFQIWNLFRLKNIKNIIIKKTAKILSLLKRHMNQCNMQDLLLINGMDLKMEKNGTNYMEKKLGKTEKNSTSYVNYVKNHLNQKSNQPKFVQTNVMQKKEDYPELMMKQEIVNSVQMNFQPINMEKKHYVHSYVKTIIELKKEEIVYNLSVRDCPEYFANDILVHNCSDAALYAWRKALNWSSVEPVPDLRTEDEQYMDWVKNSRKKSDYEQLQDRSESIEWNENDF